MKILDSEICSKNFLNRDETCGCLVGLGAYRCVSFKKASTSSRTSRSESCPGTAGESEGRNRKIIDDHIMKYSEGM